MVQSMGSQRVRHNLATEQQHHDALKYNSRWKMSLWKDPKHHMSLGNCKLHQQDTTTYLLEWCNSRTLITPHADDDVEQEDLSFIPGGTANGTATLQESLTVSCKTNTPTI